MGVDCGLGACQLKLAQYVPARGKSMDGLRKPYPVSSFTLSASSGEHEMHWRLMNALLHPVSEPQ